MLRVLLLLALVVAVVLWWKHQKRGQRADGATSTKPQQTNGPEAMLRCAECGLHLPASQSLPGRGGAFCSAEHRQQFEARG